MSSLTSRPANYSPNVNGFRGVCVALVFLHHVANSGLPPPADSSSLVDVIVRDLFMSFGYGVELFFMISGFVIVNSLRRHATVSGFLRDRALRIFPVWLPICVCLCVGAVLAHRPGFEAGESMRWLTSSLANMALLPPLVPVTLAHPASWSLTYEWVFYLLSACAALLWRRPAAPWAAKLLWALAAAALVACFPRALFFMVGVWVAMAPDSLASIRPLMQMKHASWLAWASLFVFLLAWYSTGVFAAEFSVPLWRAVAEGHGLGIIVAFFAGLYLFASVALPGARGMGFLNTRAAQHLGTISYSFYLVHPLAMAAVKFALLALLPDARGHWSTTVAFALVSALAAWGLSWLAWRWLEQGFGRWLKARGASRHASRHASRAASAPVSDRPLRSNPPGPGSVGRQFFTSRL